MGCFYLRAHGSSTESEEPVGATRKWVFCTASLGRNRTMAHIRPEVHKAVAENDIGDVVFQDPLSEDARKAKRNLVAASFAALLVAALDLQISGFLGLQTASGATIGSNITKGLACLVVLYFVTVFLLAAFVDYSAWKFKRERALVKPYLELIAMVEAHFHTTGEQVKNATQRVAGIVVERDMRSQVEFQEVMSESQGQLRSIQEQAASLHVEIQPLLAHWSRTVSKAERLTWRLRARFLSLWLLDLGLPVLLAAAAVWKTSLGLSDVWLKVTA